MAVIEAIIQVNEDGSLSFGDYLSEEKQKREDFEANGDLYKVKTYQAVTRLEKNGKLLLETVPGTAVHRLTVTETTVDFDLEGVEDTRVTLELTPEAIYRVRIEDTDIGNVKAGISGKVIFSLDLDNGTRSVAIRRN